MSRDQRELVLHAPHDDRRELNPQALTKSAHAGSARSSSRAAPTRLAGLAIAPAQGRSRGLLEHYGWGLLRNK